MKIATVYPNADIMVLYFNGKANPRVDPKHAKSMQPRLRKIVELNKTKQEALAAFFMSYKK